MSKTIDKAIKGLDDQVKDLSAEDALLASLHHAFTVSMFWFLYMNKGATIPEFKNMIGGYMDEYLKSNPLPNQPRIQ